MADLDDVPDLIPVIPPGNHVARGFRVDWVVANDMSIRMFAADKSMKFLYITRGEVSCHSFLRFLRRECADDFTLIEDNHPNNRVIFEKDGHRFTCDVNDGHEGMRGVSPNIMYVRGGFVHKTVGNIVLGMLSGEGNEAFVVGMRFGIVRFVNFKDDEILKHLKEI